MHLQPLLRRLSLRPRRLRPFGQARVPVAVAPAPRHHLRMPQSRLDRGGRRSEMGRKQAPQHHPQRRRLPAQPLQAACHNRLSQQQRTTIITRLRSGTPMARAHCRSLEDSPMTATATMTAASSSMTTALRGRRLHWHRPPRQDGRRRRRLRHQRLLLAKAAVGQQPVLRLLLPLARRLLRLLMRRRRRPDCGSQRIADRCHRVAPLPHQRLLRTPHPRQQCCALHRRWPPFRLLRWVCL